MSPSSPRSAARRAERSPVFRGVARAGFVANGVLHVLLGALILFVAFGSGSAQTDQGGAFEAVAQAPGGTALLWVLTIALWALGLWHGVQAFLADGEGTDRAKAIVKHAAQAVTFLAVGAIGAAVAMGGSGGGNQGAQQASGGILAMPGGPILLGLGGLVVLGIGVGFVVIGVTRGFRKKLTLTSGGVEKGIVAIGTVGYIAKGVALGAIGVLLVVAAVRVDPSAAGGLDAALKALMAMPAGPVLGVVIGAGFIAYGVFEATRAKFGTLE